MRLAAQAPCRWRPLSSNVRRPRKQPRTLVAAKENPMRTTLFLAAGLLLLAAFFILARLFSENYPSAATWATIAFLVLWLVVTGANMWVGVNKAGYSAAEELPILLLLFGVPAVVAILLKWKVL
jgi:hypothetical protein